MHCIYARTHRLRSMILSGVFLVSAAIGAAPSQSSLLNKPAPAFAQTSLDGKRVDLAAMRGRVVLLNFWATWCAGCQIEMPRFVQWQRKYQANGLSILGVSMDDNSETVKSFLRKKNLNYPVLMGDEKLGTEYGGVLGLPLTYLIDRQGMIRARYESEKDLDGMESAIRRLLNTK